MRLWMSFEIAMPISRVRPYLPFEMTLALIMLSMSSSVIMSDMRRCVRGFNDICEHIFLYVS